MRFNVALNLRSQTVPDKVENGRNYVLKIGGSTYFAAPNPLPHPTLAAYAIIINNLETAYDNSLGGSKLATVALAAADLAYDNATTELGHYVEDRANADPTNGNAIIIAAGMRAKTKTKPSKADFAAKNTKISGTVKLAVKAIKGAVYVWQQSPDPAFTSTHLPTWVQVKVSKKATITVAGLTSGAKMVFRFAYIIDDEQQDWSDDVSITVT